MMIRPRRLALITTRRCTAECEHCCFGCSPRASEAIPVDRLHGLIDEAARIESMHDVGFTGGECFLLHDELVRLTRRADAYGLRTDCVTNGYWAISPRAATARVEPLRDAGLKSLTLTTGTFHAKYVPVERVVFGALAGARAGIPTVVRVERCGQSTFDGGRLEGDPALAEALASGAVTIDEFTWANGVHGDERLCVEPLRAAARFQPGHATRCATILDTLSVTPSCMLYACCGVTMEGIPELALGSVATRSIQDVLDASQDDLLKIWLHVDGPELVLRTVARWDPSIALPLDSAHICTTCLFLHRDEKVRRALREHAHTVESDVLTRYRRLRARTAARHARNGGR